jgi:hypothetical protein
VKLRIEGRITAAWQTDLLERDLRSLPTDGRSVELFMRPFQLLTVRVMIQLAPPSEHGS